MEIDDTASLSCLKFVFVVTHLHCVKCIKAMNTCFQQVFLVCMLSYVMLLKTQIQYIEKIDHTVTLTLWLLTAALWWGSEGGWWRWCQTRQVWRKEAGGPAGWRYWPRSWRPPWRASLCYCTTPDRGERSQSKTFPNPLTCYICIRPTCTFMLNSLSMYRKKGPISRSASRE